MTHRPEYYRWNQWIFTRLYERGLAYRKPSLVNWCPFDQTVLANEQVVGGLCERCDTPVTKKKLTQWYFKVTDYADELLDGLETLRDTWPSKVIAMQRNWIGRSRGADVQFVIEGRDEPITDLHDPPRHALRRDVHGGRRGLRPGGRTGRGSGRRHPGASSPPTSRRSRATPRSSASAPTGPRRASSCSRYAINPVNGETPADLGVRLRARRLRPRRDHGRPRPRPARPRLRPRDGPAHARRFSIAATRIGNAAARSRRVRDRDDGRRHRSSTPARSTAWARRMRSPRSPRSSTRRARASPRPTTACATG